MCFSSYPFLLHSSDFRDIQSDVRFLKTEKKDKNKIAKLELFWMTKSLKIFFYWKGFATGQKKKKRGWGDRGCTAFSRGATHLHTILWQLLGQTPLARTLRLYWKRGSNYLEHAQHTVRVTFISVKHMGRVSVASKRSLKNTMHATVTKRKDFLIVRSTAQGSKHLH